MPFQSMEVQTINGLIGTLFRLRTGVIVQLTGVILKLTLVETFTMISLNKSVYGQHLTKEITDIYLK